MESLRDRHRHEALREDLQYVAKGRREQYLASAGSHRIRQRPTLVAIVQTIVGDVKWNRSANEALSDVLREAITERLPEFFPESSKYHGRPMRLPAELMYCYRNAEVPKYKALMHEKEGGHDEPLYDEFGKLRVYDYNKDYQPAARAALGTDLDKNTSERALGVIRGELASILLQMETEAIERRDRARLPALSSRFVLSYISRRDLETAFHRLVGDGNRIFLFHGDAGTGKSSLAYKLASDVTGDANKVIRLQMDDQDLLAGQLADYLDARDVSYRDGHLSVLKRTFARTLTDDGAPKAVVLDAAPDVRSVKLLLPDDLSQIKPFVLVTSRENVLSGELGVEITVDNLTEAEAVTMVQSRLPAVSELDAAILSKELDYRPLAIEHASALIRQGETVSDVCSMLRLNPLLTLDTTPTDRKLTTIYRRLLALLEGDSQYTDVIRLLDLILAAGYGPADVKIVEAIWLSNCTTETHPVPSVAERRLEQRRIQSAASELARLGLIRSYETDDPGIWSMHVLTRQLLYQLRRTQVEKYVADVINAIVKHVDEIQWVAGHQVTHSDHHWLPAGLFAIRHSEITQASALEPPKLLRATAFLICCAREGDCVSLFSDFALELYRAYVDNLDASVKEARRALSIELFRAGAASSILLPEGRSLRTQLNADAESPYLYDAVLGDFHFSLWYEYIETDVMRDVAASAGQWDELSPLVRARWRQLHALLACAHSKWGDADRFYEESFTLAGQSPGLEGQAIALESLRRALELHIRSDRYEDLESWLLRYEQWRVSKENSSADADDRLADLRLEHTLINIDLHKAFRGLASFAELDASNFDQMGKRYLKTLGEFGSLENDRMATAAFLDCLPLLALGDVCNAEVALNEVHSKMHRNGDISLCLAIETALMKFLPAHRAVHGESFCDDFERRAHSLVDLAQANAELRVGAYWIADAYLTAWMLGKLSGSFDPPFFASLESKASTMLAAIDRPDRLALVERITLGNLSSLLLLAS